MSVLFPKTVDDDTVVDEVLSSEGEEMETVKVRKRKRKGVMSGFNSDFHFGDADVNKETDHYEGIKSYLKKTVASTLQEKINAEREKLEMSGKTILGGKIDDTEKTINGTDKDDDLVQEFAETSDRIREKKVKVKGQAQDFFDDQSENLAKTEGSLTFYDMKLSRPVLKAVMEAGYTQPTPIQSACIPVALAGKDVCACSATGTGKTAAFMLPILERLLYRPKGQRSVTRVLVLVPTRELAIQVFQVSRKLAQFTSIELCLCAGGLDLKSQEAALRLGLDIVIATPGRLIDHLHNSPSFSLLDVEVLVLDEADRMLDEQFAEQMKEIIRLCSKTRQTMLFSATMTEEIEDLVRMSLDKPVRLFVNENTATASNLRQEFIRLREGREKDREAIVAALATRNFPDHTIVFVKTKRDCERMTLLLGLLGVRAGQLHGGLSQSQRIMALTAFKAEQLDILVCTDLASRGLDIDGVLTVINMHMPMSVKPYVHRVGRTARAGKSGRSISLIGEDDRKLLKAIYKHNKDKSLQIRAIAPEVVNAYAERIESLNTSVRSIQLAEMEEKAARQAENALAQVEGRLKNKPDEREGRVWFQSKEEKSKEKSGLRKYEMLRSSLGKLKIMQKALKAKEKRAEKTPEERDLDRNVAFQVRQAKRDKRQKRMRVVEDDDEPAKKRGKFGKGKPKKKSKSSFTGALTSIDNKSLKKIRYGPDDRDFNKAKKSMTKRGSLKGPRK